MKQEIKIERMEERTDLIKLGITNGVVAISFELINYPDRLKEFGRHLATYPLQPDRTLFDFKATLLYHGDRRRRGWTYYFDRFAIDVYPYKTNGEAAITVTLQNKMPGFFGNSAEFTLLTNAASVVELGEKLSIWNAETDNELFWEADILSLD